MADGMKWTREQRDAIEARRGTVLVAAAAGSGKTAVLVQRAIQRLTDPEHPTPADRLLIVTFTKAAAAEMRARLEKRVYDLIRESPKDPLLRRQSILLSQAHIGTVDSFCAEMAREFFHLLDLEPDFKILSGQQEEELTNAALDEVMQEAFETGGLKDLADAFAGERDDRRLARMALTLYRFMQSHPFPEKWLEEKAGLYQLGDASLWERVVLEYAGETAQYCETLLTSALRIAEEDEAVKKAFSPALLADREDCARLRELAAQGQWDEAAVFLTGFSLHRRGGLRGYEEDPLRLQLENVRQEVKKALGDLQKCLCATQAQNRGELEEAAPLVRGLADLTLSFSKRYQEKKKERGALDYSDLEHCAIRLFCREDGSPTPAAIEVSNRFDEIMIDEYQDINEVQDSLFRAVSRQGNNLFLVGDVKQSIYGFRQAMPEIFLRIRESFPMYDREKDGYPASIVLDRNFRSRREVTDTVNFVFSLLMTKASGDVDYTGGERLVCGADYGEKAGCETEMQLIERRTGVTAETAESAWIAKRIGEMMDAGFTVSEKKGERPIRYGDFCILLRSANKYAHAYAEELKRLGIPAKAAVSGGFFEAAEIQTAVSLLRVIDNPNQDIPLLSVLMSPIYGFTADDAARLRIHDRQEPVYLSLLRAAKTDERCQKVIQEIKALRAVAATMPADAFLTMLYGKTGYADLALAMENGEGRLRNLRLLQRFAKEYESFGYNGLSGFVRFLDRMAQSGSDFQADGAQPEGDAVSVMSIHKSKGLEFPVCILAGCGRNFVSDQRDDVLLHPRLGLGVKLKDAASGARYTTTVREAIALETARSASAEELRVLYVAMTRAKEKLLLVGSGEHMARTLEKLALKAAGGGISPYAVRGAKNALQWLALCALCHPDGEELRQAAGCTLLPCLQDQTPWRVGISQYEPLEKASKEEKEAEALPDLALYERLKQRLDFTYPYGKELGVPVKVAASKLAAEEAGEREISLSRPAWLGEKGMTPAERGIALHEFMQFADFPAAATDPEQELKRLVLGAYLSREQAEAVDLRRVRAFFEGELGRRVLASPQVEKERRFTAVIPASMAGQAGEGREGELILQGSVDCAFLEGDRLHIIDFKTDRVEGMDVLWQRYRAQIRLYAYAMEEVTGFQVGEMILYSTWLNKAGAEVYH